MKGTIVKRRMKRPGSKAYSVRWRDEAGAQHSRNFRLRRDAEKFLASVVSSVHDGTFRKLERLPMEKVFDLWLERCLAVREQTGEIKHSTAGGYRCLLKIHLRPTLGSYRSDRLSYRAVADWARGLAQRVGEGEISTQTYNHLLSLLHAILAWARHPAQSYLSHDPLAGVKRLRMRRPEREYLEPHEIRALLEAAAPPDDTILALAVYSGLRRGEVFALQWGDLDWGPGQEGGRLFVRRSIYHGRITTPKTDRSARVVDVPQRILDDLAVYKAIFPAIGEGFVFRTASGTPLDPDNFRTRRWPGILEAAGLRQIGFHALRHTYASLLINQGESIKYVSRQLGHASIQTTADTYGHLFRETSLAAMKRLESGMPRRVLPEPKGDRSLTDC